MWWWTAHEQPDGTFQPRILAADPAGGEPKEMLALSAQLSPVTGGIVAVTLSEAEDHPQTGIVRIDTDGTVTELVRFTQDSEASWGAQRLASSGNIVAISTGEAVLIMDTSATPIAQIPSRTTAKYGTSMSAQARSSSPHTNPRKQTKWPSTTTTNTLQTIHVPRAETDNCTVRPTHQLVTEREQLDQQHHRHRVTRCADPDRPALLNAAVSRRFPIRERGRRVVRLVRSRRNRSRET